MDNKAKFVMFAGASGVGKTTSAKMLEKSNEVILEGSEEVTSLIPFISGSVSDLLPHTKDMSHVDMLGRDSSTLHREDYQVLSLRKNLFHKAKEKGNFVCDRSFLDLAAYFLYKQADKIPQCEVEHFLNLCKQLIPMYCSHLVFIEFTSDMVSEWGIEDNNKRICSNYFQMEISRLMNMILDLWGVEYIEEISMLKPNKWYNEGLSLKYGATKARLETINGSTEILLLREVNLGIRDKIINDFVDGKI